MHLCIKAEGNYTGIRIIFLQIICHFQKLGNFCGFQIRDWQLRLMEGFANRDRFGCMKKPAFLLQL